MLYQKDFIDLLEINIDELNQIAGIIRMCEDDY